MKLLFVENLSRHLAGRLASTVPDSAHVTGVGLQRATHREVWQHAGDHSHVLVSKDFDFNDLAFIHGAPPKDIWLRVGNAPIGDIAEMLATAGDAISRFAVGEQDAVLVLRLVVRAADNDAR